MRTELNSQVLRDLIARQCESADVEDVTVVLDRLRDTFVCVPTDDAKADCDLLPVFDFEDMEFPDRLLGAPASVAHAWLEGSVVWAEITQHIEFTLEQRGSWPKWMDCAHFAIGGPELAGCNW